PWGRDLAARSPLWELGDGPLARLVRGAALDHALPPHSGRPAGDLAAIETGVPVIREVGDGGDEALVDETLPEVGDLLGGVAVDGDLPGVALDSEPDRACLPHQGLVPAGALRRIRRD